MQMMAGYGAGMVDIVKGLFDSSGFMRRHMCGGWSQELIWLHSTSDILIWLAYLTIPLLLAFFMWRRSLVPLHGLVWLFCAFIVSCGFSHLLDAMMFHVPVYRLFGLVKLITAVVSWAAVVAMVPIMPRALDYFWSEETKTWSPPKVVLPLGSLVSDEHGMGRRYAVAVASTVVAVSFRLAFQPVLGQQMLFLPLMLAVVVSSWFGGVGPGLLATAGGILAGFTMSETTAEAAASNPLGDYVRLALFTVASVCVALISESQRSARRRVSLNVAELTGQRAALEMEIDRRQEVEIELRAREQELKRQAADLEEIRRQTAESLAILKAFVNHAPLGMFFRREDGKLLFRNRFVEELTDGKRGGATAIELCSKVPALAAELQRVYEEVRGTKQAVVARGVTESEAVGPGLERTWSIGLFPVRITEEDTLGVGGVIQEITELVRAEALARESENRFRVLAESVPQMVWATDATGACYYFNNRWYEYTGLSKEDSVGSGWVAALVTEDRDRALQVWQEAVLEEQPYNIEYRFRRADGVARWFLGRGILMRDDAGKVSSWFGTCTDIDDIKRAEAALRESQERFRLLAESLPQIIWTSNSRGETDYLNPRWCEYTGMGQEESLAGGWAQVIHADDLKRAMAEWERCKRDGTLYQSELRLKRGFDESYRWHLIRAVPLRDGEGSVTQWVGSSTDVDDQHRQAELLERLVAERTEELKRSNQQLEQFASIASHDLQEPLRKIQAFGDRLKRTSSAQLGERGNDYLDRILASSTRLRNLIEDLLQFSRVTTTARPMQQVDLNQIVEEVVSDLEELVQKTDGRVVIRRLPVIWADGSQMRQLFLNLIGNGLKFHRPGVSPIVEVTARKLAVEVTTRKMTGETGTIDGKGWHEIRVTDNGIGFEEIYRERIFKLFERLHGQHQYGGTGIGLSICRKIVERHGGTISAEGRPDAGATFIVELPESPEPKFEGESR